MKTKSLLSKNLLQQLKIKGIKLNKEQETAVADIEGACAVHSMAGTGKTTVLVARIMAIAEAHPEANILALSFSKKSCQELMKRLNGVMNVTVSTLHSFMYSRILRSEGFYRNCRFITTEAERRSLIKKAIYESGNEAKLTVPDVIEALAKGVWNSEAKTAACEAYLDILKDRRILCYDSLAYLCIELLRYQPAVVAHVRNSIDYVLIDEFQDSNSSFLSVLKLVFPASAKPNISMIGDYHQSIYGFRGASPVFAKGLEEYYNAKVFNLSLNYRSTPEILAVANAVLPATDIKLKPAKNIAGEKPLFFAAKDSKDEANFVASKMKELHEQGCSYNDMAVLFRASAVTNDVYEELLKQNIPFIRIGSTTKYENSRFKCLLALLSSLYDSNHSSFYWQCSLPILGASSSLMTYISSIENNDVKSILTTLPSLSRSQRQRFSEFFAIDVEDLTFDQVVSKLFHNYLKPYFKAEDDSILDEFREIIGKDSSFTELRDHIFEIRRRERAMKHLVMTNQPHAKLISIHGSKGLQFPIVFIIGASNGVMPLTKPDAVVDEAEEHRLAYVSASRAEQQLIISYPKTGSNGSTQSASPYFTQFFKD